MGVASYCTSKHTVLAIDNSTVYSGFEINLIVVMQYRVYLCKTVL